MTRNNIISLDVAIIGGGIAGLATAIALRRAGHQVTVYEKSRFSNEVGAAIHCAPNATRVLEWLGFDFIKANAVKNVWSHLGDGKTGEALRSNSLAHIESQYMYPWYFFHRVDLHNGLKDLAFGEVGQGIPAVLKLQSRLASVNATDTSLNFEDGSVVSADLIIGADGVHSTLVKWVVQDEVSAYDTGHSAFRFLVPVQSLLEDPETRWLVVDKPSTMNIFKIDDRRLVAYPCRNGELMNFVCIHPDGNSKESKEEWNVSADSDRLAKAYSMFHSSLRALCRHSEDLEDLKLWKLLYRPPIKTWTRGKCTLIGDAAHPMLPHQGQGGGMSIEDAGALGVLFSNIDSKASIPARLQMFQSVRYNRASAVQIFSNFGQDEATMMAAEAAKYGFRKVPTTQMEFHQFLYSYNVLEDTKARVSKEFFGTH
ncbi:uncharacterized protein A1O9_03960 [Exophiala aquamarina CBS 119918]|uniref:FAD-binding domain-containing protein n=1 Tax=Exophiala aquamarina CBS 119918 TaxID=1182545 RepID=A0A072PGX0_9EURO|nr:uncharacterized protein A1O9_03960 [Exophiala aquamarina CBS 119918]KEF59116.1 hypothetical protein A1O9_03960 [Exophiala aquamarina CBS 119918]